MERRLNRTNFKSKKHVIYFYPRDFTPGCTTEADEFSKDYNKFKKVGVEIIGISKDDVESHKKFCEKMKIPYHFAFRCRHQSCKKIWSLGQKES